MGNLQSQTPAECLKTLYQMDQSTLDKLFDGLKARNYRNDSLLSQIRQRQLQLKGKVNSTNYNMVSGFLNDISMIQFKEAEEKKAEVFQQEQNERIGPNESDLQLFGLDIDFDHEDLKDSYKHLAMMYHPDRETGDLKKFRFVTKVYKRLLEVVKMRRPQADFNEMRDNSREASMSYEPSSPVNRQFNPQLFNKIYEENRIQSPNDDGYGDWINDNQLEDKDIERNSELSSKFSKQKFNDTFNKTVKSNKDYKMVKYNTPQALNSSAGIDSTELGVDKIDNFSGNGYSDYREAHSTNRLVPDNARPVIERNLKNIEEFEESRKRMVPLSIQELRELKAEEKIKSEFELKRQKNVAKHDQNYFNHYEQVNRRMIENNFFR